MWYASPRQLYVIASLQEIETGKKMCHAYHYYYIASFSSFFLHDC